MFCGEPFSSLRLSAVSSTFGSELGRVKGPRVVVTPRSRLEAYRWLIRAVCLGGQKIL
jgi:hypothetical protein